MSDNTTDDEAYELTAEDLAGIQLRTMLADSLGKQYGGDRDLYDAFGWIKDPDIEDFYAMYLRNPYGRAVVDIPAATTWRDGPDLTDEEASGADESTEFEDDVATFVEEQRAWHYCKRADKLAGIGEFALLVIGFADGKELVQPVDEAKLDGDPEKDVDWLRPFSQKSVDTLRTGDATSGRWGEPIYYKLDLGDEDDQTAEASTQVWVHHSRVVHIAENLLDDEVRGTPRQEPVLNPLFDIEKTMGAAAEMAYRGADYGLAVNVDKDYDLQDGGEKMEKEMQNFIHGFSKTLQLEAADVEQIGGNDIDPTPIINPEIEALSAYTGIPQSVLKGNETGERATSEDLKEWYGKITERRTQFAGPTIVRELIDRLRKFDVVADPSGDGYELDWPALAEQSELDESEVMVNRAQIIKFVQSMLAEYGTAEVTEFIEDGEFPEVEAAGAVPELDEDDEEVEAYFQERVAESSGTPAGADD